MHQSVEAGRVELDQRRAPRERDVGKHDQAQAAEQRSGVEGDAERLGEAEQEPRLEMVVQRPAAAQAVPETAPLRQSFCGRPGRPGREPRIHGCHHAAEQAEERRSQRGNRKQERRDQEAEEQQLEPDEHEQEFPGVHGLLAGVAQHRRRRGPAQHQPAEQERGAHAAQHRGHRATWMELTGLRVPARLQPAREEGAAIARRAGNAAHVARLQPRHEEHNPPRRTRHVDLCAREQLAELLAQRVLRGVVHPGGNLFREKLEKVLRHLRRALLRRQERKTELAT